MQHRINLEEISDGTLYTKNDMVRIGCDGCDKTASCCRFAEDTITLDPYDIYQLQLAVGLSFEALYSKQLVALSPVDGLLLPHLNFSTETGSCPFLLEHGRCSIHAHRPGLCRLFPLARLIDNDTVRYLIQIHECPCSVTPKTKIKKWLDLPEIERYETYIIRWNEVLSETRRQLTLSVQNERTADSSPSGTALTTLTTNFLRTYFFTPYDTSRSFYEQWEQRRLSPQA